MHKTYQLFILILLICFALPANASADGIIIPEPPICDPGPCPPWPVPMTQLEIRYHNVSVEIEDQIAITRVDQVFYNPNDWQIEGTYLFPIPEDTAITSFNLWVDGEPVQGEILEAKIARQRYEEIVRSLQDPALLEYAGRGVWQARIFPIEPKSERRVELEYVQTLSADSGLVKYVYPLSTEKFSTRRLDNVSINVVIRSKSPLRAIYSPTHVVEILKESQYIAEVGYEEYDVLPDRDFGLYYSIGDDEAFHLLTYRDPNDLLDRDGFFLAMIAPSPDASALPLPKDVILVLDRSGSMEGEKFTQAQEALKYILRNLKEYDRFNIIAFSSGIDTYAGRLRSADEFREAEAWVDRLSARGNTDINRALLEAASYADHNRPTYIIFLTDGLPTVGEMESDQILGNFGAAATDDIRLFAFGVGYDVDTYLLDSIAENHHGASAYVLPGERLDESISGFYEKISTPVLTDLELDFDGISVYDLYPDPLPDLFVGSQILVLGRYRQSGVVDLELTGEVNGEIETFRFVDQVFPEKAYGDSKNLAELPRLWATRKIGYLLNQIRLHGLDEETINQIVQLSIRYGIVTQFTSYLVTEDAALGEGAQERIVEEQFSELQAMPAAEVSGQDAVERASEQGALAKAESIQGVSNETRNLVRQIGSRTFVFKDGTWIDTAFDPEKMTPKKIVFLSDDYFRLLDAFAEIGPAFALGQQVITFAGQDVFQVVPMGEFGDTLPDMPTPVSQVDQKDDHINQVEETSTPGIDQKQPGPTPTVDELDENPNNSAPTGGCLNLFLPLPVVLIGIIARSFQKSKTKKIN